MTTMMENSQTYSLIDGKINKSSRGFSDCLQKKWVVYCEKPFKCPDNLIAYLGNYTHRVAISSHRIIDCKDGKVTFWYKDYRSGGIRKEMTVTANEFIRRFLQHALPRGVVYPGRKIPNDDLEFFLSGQD